MNDNLKTIIARLGKALTDEDAAFNFPVKYPAIDLDRPTKNALYKTAAIIAGGLIVMAFIISRGKK